MIFSLILLQSCGSTIDIKPIKSDIKVNQVLSNTAAISSVLCLSKKNKDLIICTQPYADAGFSQDDSFSLSVNLLNFGGNDSESSENSAEDIEFEGRTPVLLMARELFYRQCEFAYNYKLNYQDALKLYNKNLDTIKELSLQEVKNTKITISESLSTNIQENVSGSKGITSPNRSTNRKDSSNTSGSSSSGSSSSGSSSSGSSSSGSSSSSNNNLDVSPSDK